MSLFQKPVSFERAANKKTAAERRRTAAAQKKRRTSGRSVSTYSKPLSGGMVTFDN
jgi:hypothetical protein